MHEVLVNRLGGLSLPRKSVVRLTDRPDMTLDVYHGRKTTMQPVFEWKNKSLRTDGCITPSNVQVKQGWRGQTENCKEESNETEE